MPTIVQIKHNIISIIRVPLNADMHEEVFLSNVFFKKICQ